jgi:hypothetical protein
MRVRLLGLLVAAVAFIAALSPAALAQDPTVTPVPTVTPTPTPTVTPEPTPTPAEEKQAKLRKRKVVRRVRRDFRDNGRIDNCKHSRLALKRTLQSISEQEDIDFPDFREAVKAAIKDWDKKVCVFATPTPAPTPAPTTAAPTPAPTTAPSTDSGGLPGFGGNGNNNDNDSGSGSSPPVPEVTATPPGEGDVAPVQPEPTAVPVTPAPAPQDAQLVVTRPDEDTSLLLPALLLAAALLGLAVAGGSALAARRGDGRLAGWGHAWREAGYRATGAWGDFSDWLRVGR